MLRCMVRSSKSHLPSLVIIFSWKTTEFSGQTMMSAYSSVFVVFNLNRTKIPLLKNTFVKVSRLF